MMNTQYTYKRLNVYIKARALVKQTYELIQHFPPEEKYALCDQLRRAIISVPSNIVEGLCRYSDKEKVHFLEIAYGSLMEAECQLELAVDLGYITQEQYEQIDKSIEVEARLISGMRAKYFTN